MESQNLKYKQDMPKSKSMKAEIVAFLNSPAGGQIYLGVDDDGKPIKFENEEQKRIKYKEWEELLVNWISNAFRPDITGLVFVNPNADVFTVSISSGLNKPYYYTDGEGINYKGIYIRNGSSKRLASDAEVRRMLNKNIANSFDGERNGNLELSFSYAQDTFVSLNKKFDVIGLEFKKNQEDSFNNAALIVSDNNPYVSKLAVYTGLDTISFKDKKLFEKSVVRQIDDVIQYIKLNNKMKITIGNNGKRIESYSYPESAVREAVVNAFVHRDYTMTSDIKIEMYDDRLVISSPGSLPDGLTVEDVKQGANAKRNPILINALDKMEYIENYGSGIRRIYSLYKGFTRQPNLIATHNLFTVILYNRNYKLNSLELNDKLIEMIEYLTNGRHASRQEIQNELKLQKSYTAELIANLRKEGIIESEGRGPATRYYLTEAE